MNLSQCCYCYVFYDDDDDVVDVYDVVVVDVYDVLVLVHVLPVAEVLVDDANVHQPPIVVVVVDVLQLLDDVLLLLDDVLQLLALEHVFVVSVPVFVQQLLVVVVDDYDDV